MPYLYEFGIRSIYIDRKIEVYKLLNSLPPGAVFYTYCSADIAELNRFFEEIKGHYSSWLSELNPDDTHELCRILAQLSSSPWSLSGCVIHKTTRTIYEELGEAYVQLVGRLSREQFEHYRAQLRHEKNKALEVALIGVKVLQKAGLLDDAILEKLLKISRPADIQMVKKIRQLFQTLQSSAVKKLIERLADLEEHKVPGAVIALAKILNRLTKEGLLDQAVFEAVLNKIEHYWEIDRFLGGKPEKPSLLFYLQGLQASSGTEQHPHQD